MQSSGWADFKLFFSSILSFSVLSVLCAAAAKLLQSCPTLCDPIDGSPPRSPVPGFSRQEHEWVAISCSNAWKWKVKVKSLSRVWLFTTPWKASYQDPPMGFSRQEYWSGLPLPSPISQQLLPNKISVTLEGDHRYFGIMLSWDCSRVILLSPSALSLASNPNC